MLSPNARAFSVDQLLSRSELQQQTKVADNKETSSSYTENAEELCKSFGEEKLCQHKHVTETEGKVFNRTKLGQKRYI